MTAMFRRATASLVLPLALAALAFAAPAAAADGDVGYRDFGYDPASSTLTGSKPESKLWWNDGTWWATMFDPATADHYIHRLDLGSQTWVRTSARVDTRTSVRGDALWDGTKLYIASHVYTSGSASGYPSYLYRYSYDTVGDAYTLDAGFPARINNYKTETLVIDKDTTGTLWATWRQGTQIYVNHTLGDDATWSTPVPVPVAGATVTSDDIPAVKAFGGKIGVMWSNQTGAFFHLAIHQDGDPDTAWTVETIPGISNADDHVNMKADSSGRLFVAVKRDTSSPSDLIDLLVRDPGTGAWATYPFGSSKDSHTRPIVVIDEGAGEVRMFATGPQPPATSGQSGGSIYMKVAPLEAPAFPAGVGTVVIRDALSDDMNDVTSTKQNVSATTGLAVMASNPTTRQYWHAYFPLTPVPLDADFAASPTAGPAPLNVNFVDASLGTPTGWSWDFGDGSTSTAQNPAHVYTTPGTYTVSLTVTKGASSSTESRTDFITVSPPPPSVTVVAEADSFVRSTYPTKNYGTNTSLRVRAGGSPTDNSYLRFTVAGVDKPVTKAILRLFVTDASPDGGSVYFADNGWIESGVGSITWDNRPLIAGPAIGSAGATVVGRWVEIDLGTAIAGNGTYTLVLASSKTNSAIYSSRQGANPPQLTVVMASP